MTNQVAQTILQQLGGNKFIVMTGAKSLMASNEVALSFRVSSTMTKNKCNYVKITLNANDLYDVMFCKIFKFELREISKFSDVYIEDLVNLLEEETGLLTKLF